MKELIKTPGLKEGQGEGTKNKTKHLEKKF